MIDQQDATLEEGQEFYNNNPFLFLSKELRDFSYVVLSFDAYREQVEIPDDYIDEAYADYLSNAESQLQNRISHLMLEKSNYESSAEAYELINSIYAKISSQELSFEEAVSASSDDLASRDSGGDLGMSSGDAFSRRV